MMTTDQWISLLTAWNKTILDNHINLYPTIPQALLDSGWLGSPPASEEALVQLSNRLGTELPPSYRSFLTASNGWNSFLDHSIYQLWPTEKVDWFSNTRQDWIDAYTWMSTPRQVSDADYFIYGKEQEPYNLRVEYMPFLLEVSDVGDSALLLLNPKVVTAEGEWEAWYFANWLPGAIRYPSFGDLMQDTYAHFLESI